MTETQIELSGSCRFTLTTYENIGHKDVCLDYTEHSPDHWHSDSETSIPLDADKAREIVAFMHKAFPEIEQPAQQEPPTVAELLCVCGAEWEWRNRDWELVATPPAQRKPLTDKEIADIATSHPLTWVNLNTVEHRRYFARSIEAAHGIKENT